MLDALQIRAILPHRTPFLFIDRVIEFSEDSIHARKLVAQTEPVLDGHFPGNPILPGVVQVEAMAQAGILLAHKLGFFDPNTQVCYFMGIQEAKFRAPVRPGDILDIHVKALRAGRISKLQGEVRCDGQVRSQATFTAIIEARPDVAAPAAGAASGTSRASESNTGAGEATGA